jgi:hypothetical protein
MSTNHLRTGLERLKNFYQKKLLTTDLYTEKELCSLTVSELAELYRKSVSPKKNSNENFSLSKQNGTIFYDYVRKSNIK